MAETKLNKYRGKRDFSKTTEPAGGAVASGSTRFVVHKHSATADHYDLRLEHDGVLLSWAVPRGPSLNPADKRLAVHTEDHPIEYIDFEGVIPEGEYGGGPMIVWDTGDWAPMEDVDAGLRKGGFKFRLWGEKLKGGWMLTKLKGRPGDNDKENWLLFKEHDPAVDTETDILAERPESVKSGLTTEQLLEAAKPKPVRAIKAASVTGAVKAPPPAQVEPQLAASATEPPQETKASHWLHEIKFDGYRTIAHVIDGKVKLITRSGIDWTKRYGDLPKEFAKLPVKQAIIDGEIVVLDEKGISRFSALQDALSEGAGSKLHFYAFDLLYLDGYDLRGAELTDRKQLLSQLLGGHISGRSAIQLSDHVEGDGEALYEQASALGLEGIVSKRTNATYQSGRTSTWVKVKAKPVGDFVIAGYTVSAAAEGLASLALAEFVDGELEYRGKCGTGFDAAMVAQLQRRLEPLQDPALALEGAPRDIIWVQPVLRCKVHYANKTSDNLLRHSVFKGLIETELTASAAPRQRLITDADLASISITNPERRLFGKSGPTKLDIAVYYAAVGDFMLPHLFNRPVSLFRCPTGLSKDCFFQRHAFKGMPKSINVFETQNSDEEDKTYLTIEDAKGYLALAQFGVVEFHAWGSHLTHLDKPDRVTFDLDPGEGIEFREVVEAAVHLRGELEAFGLVPFVKTSGGKGLHLVVPIEPKQTWKQVHAVTGEMAATMAKTAPDTFVTTIGAQNRKRRILIDIHRNARSATAVSPYSLRARTNMPASTPLDWRDLESIDAPVDLNYSTLPGLLTTSGDPWAEINLSARPLPASSKAGRSTRA
ncbi:MULTISPECIES: DNA ligase D [unclassified Devosia]|uniref:DNA ligase D n=1 Tax=unclassified Devosia TaxID=196773 RepID=UPI00096543CA|nr:MULTISPECIES: DNA ligase D [unclassified Devosia]MBN9363272.1 DNA ligase D [Devosia sp.]OJX25114.1 MAG: DNA ligase D [Devosia sp. 66-14]